MGDSGDLGEHQQLWTLYSLRLFFVAIFCIHTLALYIIVWLVYNGVPPSYSYYYYYVYIYIYAYECVHESIVALCR